MIPPKLTIPSAGEVIEFVNMETKKETIISAFEFDSNSAKEPFKIEVRETQYGAKLILVGKNQEEECIFESTVDQWGTWYFTPESVVAQEWGTRSFISALIAGLEVFRKNSEAETLEPTKII